MIIRIIAFSTLLFYLGPVIRFRKHTFFYFFYIMLIVPPILYLIRYYLSTWTIAYFPIMALVILFSYPLIAVKTKLILSFPAIISLLHLVDSPIISFITVEVIFLYLMLDLIYLLYKEIDKRHQFFIYELLFVVEFFFDGLKVFIYFEDIKLFTQLYPWISIVSILNIILFTIAGPNFIFKTKSLEVKRAKDIGTKYDLTAREIEILRLISLGMTSKEIADKLFISEKTAKNHRTHINMKLRCLTKTDMIKIYNDEISQIDLILETSKTENR